MKPYENILITVSKTTNATYASTVIPGLLRLSNSHSDEFQYFVRTWDSAQGNEIVQIVLSNTCPGRIQEEQLVTIFSPLEVRIEVMASQDIPSPLWNSGISGPCFHEISRWLFRSTAKLVLKMLRSWTPDGAYSPNLFDAIHLLVGHGRATVTQTHKEKFRTFNSTDLFHLRLLSYRSHYESVFARALDPIALENAFEAKYADVGSIARNSIISPNSIANSSINAWMDFISRTHMTLIAAFDSKELVDRSKKLEDLVEEVGHPIAPTRFHGFMTPQMQALMYRDPDFLAFRLETSLLYSVLFSLGFSLPERYLLCYLVARANEDVSGLSAIQLRDRLDDLAISLRDNKN